MQWHDHSRYKGRHALFAPSQPGFLQRSEEEIRAMLLSKEKAGLGTEVHDWCRLKIKRRHKITSIKEMVKSIDEFIFEKYYREDGDYLPPEGKRLLRAVSLMTQDQFETIKNYVNDAISFRMDPEVVLLYSDRFFGTTDAISYSNGMLRIHDLKTGTTPAHIEQLLIYDAVFCLEYAIDPASIEHELRIYQNNDILIGNPEADAVLKTMDVIRTVDKIQYEFEEGTPHGSSTI